MLDVDMLDVDMLICFPFSVFRFPLSVFRFPFSAFSNDAFCRVVDFVDEVFGGGVGAHLVVQDILTHFGDALLHTGTVVETFLQGVFDGLVEDAEALLLPFVVEIAVLFGESHVFHHFVPYLLDAQLAVRRTENDGHGPLRVGHGEEVQRVAVLLR